MWAGDEGEKEREDIDDYDVLRRVEPIKVLIFSIELMEEILM